MAETSWQRADVVSKFLDETRAAIPYGIDQVQIALRAIHHFRVRPQRFIDLGCGDGYLARVILNEFPDAQAVLVDHSEAMLKRAKIADERVPAVQLVQEDLADPLLAWTAASAELVVASYSIHHLPHERKRSLYQEIFRS